MMKNVDDRIYKNRWFQLLAVLLVVVPVTVKIASPIWDIDVWWHLATGREIVHTGSFLKTDPFNSIPPSYLDPNRMFLLNGYWLAQVLFYASHALGGPAGLILCKVAIFLAVPLLVFSHGVRKGWDFRCTLLLMVLCGWVSTYFSAERPQILSMLLFAMLMLLLSRIGYIGSKEDSGTVDHNLKPALLLPPLMVLWANSHPGYTLGAAVLVLYALSETTQHFIHSKPPANRTSLLKVVILILVALAATGINPNGFDAFLGLLKNEGSDLQSRSSEYMSPFAAWKDHGILVTPFFIYVALYLVTCGSRVKKLDPTFLLISLSLLVISFRSYRYIPFFVFGTTFGLGAALNSAVFGSSRLKRGCTILAMCSLILLWYSSARFFPRAYASLASPVNTYRFPVAASDFLKKEKPSGRIFNYFNWGGYLIWSLYPEHQVFIDGRSLSLKAFDEYTRVLWTPEWKDILHRHNMNMIILSTVDDFTGELYQVVNHIAADPSWHLVYCDDTTFVALEGTSNQPLIAAGELPKLMLYQQAASKAELLLRRGMNNPAVWQTLATAYSRTGHLEKAAEARRRASGK
ncbi:hypothetical protein [Geobacter sp. DSM 9736]|uniref:hypothetical protein n=1 Tax=Geobacter sp. DSM 9736 TaxID=1277350 RepID=UPI000B503516|nr:hypothetical protein [Geobacter sp. DSM 9736]SNB47212.1 hypothetical protein SAMN06269301_2690 [Geobacter sp. DSM 9736]